MRLLVATRSGHKLAEIEAILDDVVGLEVLGPDQAGVRYSEEEEGLEPFDTFEENARSKAEYFFSLSGLLTVADDSGIGVDALTGGPGVRSKRFAPERYRGEGDRDQANNLYLLDRLADVPEAERTAHYTCVASLIGPDGEAANFRGDVAGRILSAPDGSGGFGYDPLFLVPELGRSFGRATAEEKLELSHRGKAFRSLAAYLRQRLRAGPPTEE